MSKFLYGDVHDTSNGPSDHPRVKALLVHEEGVLFYHPTRKRGRRQALPKKYGWIQELLFTEGLHAVRALGQDWFEGFVDIGGYSG